ncbi:hypothetical protein [Streptomyces sp. WG5]|uniref:hypothetical protein n=1 Tax=Streptomyces sp. WG5 TaxID=3417648 RepID=UPI003CE9D01B
MANDGDGTITPGVDRGARAAAFGDEPDGLRRRRGLRRSSRPGSDTASPACGLSPPRWNRPGRTRRS